MEEEEEMGSRMKKRGGFDGMSLQLECYDMELSPEQKEFYCKDEEEFNRFQSKFQSIIQNRDVTVDQGEHVSFLEFFSGNNIVPRPEAPLVVPNTAQPTSNIIVQSANNGTGNYQLVVDPRLGVIVGSSPNTQQLNTNAMTVTPRQILTTTSVLRATAPSGRGPVATRGGKSKLFIPVKTTNVVQQQQPIAPQPRIVRGPAPLGPGGALTVAGGGGNLQQQQPQVGVAAVSLPTVPQPQPLVMVRGPGPGPGPAPRPRPRPPPVQVRRRPAVVDLTDDDGAPNGEGGGGPSRGGGVGIRGRGSPRGRGAGSSNGGAGSNNAVAGPSGSAGPSNADSKEVSINKMSGKTFPSLVVVARPHLTSKDCSPAQAQTERQFLDNKVKKVLMVTASSFTEWLLQTGLLRCEQFCTKHVTTDGNPVKLKLGMYSDTAKFPYSGGYVWISECCPQQFVSVFSGSIFEGAPHPPSTLLKLLYHWSCHTSIQNVTQWVRVDNLYVKGFYTHLRAVCTAAVHNKCTKMGGIRKKIQVGVISLGTTTQDGSTRQVKVEVLGVLDPESKHLRIRAIEPIQEGEKNYKKRFMKILEPLQHWVEKESIILTDYTVDKGTLLKMGYSTVYQVSASESTPNNKYSNHTIMDYLRKIVPRMFQNTLSLLSRAIIQQFLDELVWRERWGQIPSKAFDTIIEHIAEQTKLETGGTFVNRLSKISANPFKNWKYDRWSSNCKFPIANTSRGEDEAGGSGKVSPKQIEPIILPSTSSSLPTIDNLPIAITQVEACSSRSVGAEIGIVTRIEKQPPSLQAATIPLDPYYYGTLPGDPQLQQHSQPFHVACEICGEEFKNNIQMMDHLIQHALNKSRAGDQKDICRLCCKVCPSQAALKTHHLQVHRESSSTSNNTSCKICAVKMRDRAGLIAHMTKTHFELELPYNCELCHFRTSVWEAMVKHFYEIHNGGEEGVCPYCFRTVKFTNKGTIILRNQYFYIMHIQKHQLSSLVRKCTRCFQWFVNKALQEQHEQTAHMSCKHLAGVERHDSEVSVLMPAPLCDPIPPSYSSTQGNKPSKSRYLQNTTNFKASNFRSLKLTDYVRSFECLECEAYMDEEHFIGVLSCTRCRYNTCCTRAMAEHNSSSHMSWTPRFTIGRPPKIPGSIRCTECRFTTSDPTAMAYHLAIECEDGVCRPVVSSSTREGGNKTILNSLGLVRNKGSSSDASSPVSLMDTEDVTEPIQRAPVPQQEKDGGGMEVVEDEGEAMVVDSSPIPESMILD